MLLVKCPRCQKQIPYDSANPFRPFCSERCRTHDLAKWAEEDYKVPDTRTPIEEADDLLEELLRTQEGDLDPDEN